MNFNVSVPVKPYVKRFLELNYGDPVDFRKYPRENEMFKRMLKKPNFDNEQKYKNELSFHTHAVDVVISDRDFYRHGWELSKTDIISFGKYFEYKAKLLMRAIVSNYISFGIAKNVAIIKFQNNFMMEEEYWPFESIKKDFQRYENSNNIDCHNYAFHHLDRLVLLNLSNAGFITNSIVRIHEKRLIESE